jgi:dipeptidyl aminopeptidase/acylaminoacyl peptidase
MKIAMPGLSGTLRIQTFVIAALPAALLVSACGSGSSAPYTGHVISPAPVAGVTESCRGDQGSGNWDALLHCPEGYICVGDIYGSTANDIVPLAAGSRPDWSADGQRIVFQRMFGAQGSDVRTIKPDGTDEVLLGTGSQPAWSPDGRQIAFVNDEGVAVMDSEGAGIAVLVRHDPATGVRVRAPEWSPDGQRIVFERRDDNVASATRLYLANADGSDVRRLTSGDSSPGFEHDPAWSPDGGSIAFINADGLATVDAGGGTPTSVRRLEASSKPAWTPDGTWLAFAEFAACGPGNVKLMPAQGGDSGDVFLFALGAHEPSFSPEAAQLAFTSAADGFAPVAGPATVYNREGQNSSGHRSRYILYADNSFSLQYVTSNWLHLYYAGSYSPLGPGVSFNFYDSNTAGPWTATGNFDGSRLSVTYNIVMSLADFEDGVYVLSETIK